MRENPVILKQRKRMKRSFIFVLSSGKKRLMLFSFTNDHLKERRKGCGMMRKKGNRILVERIRGKFERERFVKKEMRERERSVQMKEEK